MSSLETNDQHHHRIAIPTHASLRLGTLNAVLRAVAQAKHIDRTTSSPRSESRVLIPRTSEPDEAGSDLRGLLDIRIDSRPRGLELAAWIDGHAPGTHVIFVTAHPEHALEAYDHHPDHFLVKPIDDSQLAKALARVRRSAPRPEGKPGRLEIRYHELDRSGETIRTTAYLRPADILYIRKNKLNNSVDVVLTHGECLTGVRQSLEHFEARLGNGGFFRIHSGCLVNLNHPWRLRPRPGEQDSYDLLLPGRGVKLPVGRLRLGRLRDLLQASQRKSDAES